MIPRKALHNNKVKKCYVYVITFLYTWSIIFGFVLNFFFIQCVGTVENILMFKSLMLYDFLFIGRFMAEFFVMFF